MTEGPALSSMPGGSSAAPASEIVIVRTGGFAGVMDTVEVAADGTAQVTSRTGETSACTPDASALDRLRAIDLAAIGSTPPKNPMADGFNYSVSSAGVSASVGEGDNDGIRAEFLAAAAGVVTSCLAYKSGGGSSEY